MSRCSRFSRGFLVLLSLAGLSAIAQAQMGDLASGELRSLVSAAGEGEVRLPNASQQGHMAGMLLDEQRGARFYLEANMSLYFTLQPVPGRIAVGGIQGKLIELAFADGANDPVQRYAWSTAVGSSRPTSRAATRRTCTSGRTTVP